MYIVTVLYDGDDEYMETTYEDIKQAEEECELLSDCDNIKLVELSWHYDHNGHHRIYK